KRKGGSVNVWAYMSASEVRNLVFIDVNIVTRIFLQLLTDNLIQSSDRMGVGRRFGWYQGNDPKHKL
ncbi:hypothetical protein KR093_009647, partial [Drosophila rubida]